MNDGDVAGHIKAFEKKRPVMAAFCDSLRGLIRQLLETSGVEFVTIEGRVKTVESFTEKIQRQGKDYHDPLSDLTDLVGLRIITYQLSAIDRISEIIRENFLIDEANSVDKGKLLDTDQFGYQSVHFIAELNTDRKSLPEYRAFGGIKCEIQVRTALQHAWAAINHKLLYKAEIEVPKDLRRHFNRISALLETADADFEVLTEKIVEKTREYREKVKASDYDLPLDRDSLAIYLNKDPKAASILQKVEVSKLSFLSKTVFGIQLGWMSAEYDLLLKCFTALGDSTIREVDHRFEKTAAIADKALPSLAKRINDPNSITRLHFATTTHALFILIVLTLTRDEISRLTQVFAGSWRMSQAVAAVYEELHPGGSSKA
ncbi:hypothetical protein KBB96_09390 [Luteolibacter ambystomatis]|uniref:RelA/SpoT domain-containing protein n=1 Tax=Luteolibacter ambystomatis TaxID=2824561 RepID=A0A975J2Z1_9BACT|nr:hypothetical protein [Luteolibacter ambystomatis]QUE53092.1 hypothetical protein KBB96_09390 [Luteolibacter ambystomatis]